MIGLILTLFLVLVPHQAPAAQVSEAQKKEFLTLLKTLPHKGEFYTDDAIKAAAPYLPVLFALTADDIEGYDFYSFGALSRGLCDIKKRRQYAIVHFNDIQSPELKLFWAVLLFNEKKPASQIVRFLKEALESEAQAKLLGEIVGPNFEEFKTRLNARKAND
jgi:hypothetical protein